MWAAGDLTARSRQGQIMAKAGEQIEGRIRANNYHIIRNQSFRK